MPGALSAVGIFLADAVRDFSRTVMLPGEAIDTLEEIFAELEQRGVPRSLPKVWRVSRSAHSTFAIAARDTN